MGIESDHLQKGKILLGVSVLAGSIITIQGIDEAISNLGYRSEKSPKYRLVSLIRTYYNGNGSTGEVTKIDTEELIRKIWQIPEGDGEAVRRKIRNFNSLKSSLNTDLLNLYKKGKNPEGIMIGPDNTFVMSEQAKDSILSQFSEQVKATGSADLGEIAEVVKLVSTLLEENKGLLNGQGTNEHHLLETLKQAVENISKELGIGPTGLGDGGTEVTGHIEGGNGAGEKDGGATGQESGEGLGSGDMVDDEEVVEQLEEVEDELLEEPVEEIIDEPIADEPGLNLGSTGEGEGIPGATEPEGGEGEQGENYATSSEEEINIEEETGEIIEDDELEFVEEEELADYEIAEEPESIEANMDSGQIEEPHNEISQPASGSAMESGGEGTGEGTGKEQRGQGQILEGEDNYSSPGGDKGEDNVEFLTEQGSDVEISEEGEDEEDLIEEEVEEGDFELHEDEGEIENLGSGHDHSQSLDPDPLGLGEGLGEEDIEAQDPATKARLLAEAFDGYLGAMDRYYNEYLLIPGGEYLVGSKNDRDKTFPEQIITLQPFYIGKFPVTNALFEIFVEKTGYVTTAERTGYGIVFEGRYRETTDPITGRKKFTWQSGITRRKVKGACWYQPSGPGSNLHGKRNHPVVQISLEDAMAFAAWTGKRLPTEAEWEASARGKKGFIFPWGDKWMENACNVETSRIGDTCPVDQFKEHINELGIVDTLGNVMEWTSTTIKQINGNGMQNVYYIAKGGGWVARKKTPLWSRVLLEPEHSSNILGFRCVAY